jgi:hypothetical protein
MRLYGRSIVALAMLVMSVVGVAAQTNADSRLKVIRFYDDARIEIASASLRATLARGDTLGALTLVEVIDGAEPFAVLEDFRERDGRIVFVDAKGVRLDLAKTSEASTVDPRTLYRGRTRDQVMASDIDLLANEILAQGGDPSYEEIAAVFPPIQKVRDGTFNFIGTPMTSEKVGFSYGGRTSYFDPAVYDDAIPRAREQGRVRHGLVGGYLPILRFVYPDTPDSWTELLAFAPFRLVNGNTRMQPVWYRVSRIENGRLQWMRHIDTYQLFPPREADDAHLFYAELAQAKREWDEQLAPAMQIDIPDARLTDMSRHSLIRAMMTRVGNAPHYGAVDKNYGGNEHDGFPDTFNVDTTTMIEWGLLERAGGYIDNYFSEYVRDDGAILYRGPETGQFGRMLTVLAHYANAGGSSERLLRHRKRVDAIANLLLGMRTKALSLPVGDPAYGMIAGWSEADSALDPDPPRYMQPYLSNSTEAARGWRDLGRVWESIGIRTGNAELTASGQQWLREAAALSRDIATAIERSLLDVKGRRVLPAIAGVQLPFHLAVQNDRLDPQHRSYRAYAEMMHSGSLSADVVRSIVDYRANHRDILLGIPTAYGYGSREVAGFLLYGHVYGLIQHDAIREALLAIYSNMAHQYTRGMWMAPETRRPLLNEDAAPYCVPAQLTTPLFARWLLVFENPEADVLWLAKAAPRDWFEHGKRIGVTGAATKWGRIDFSIESKLSDKAISARIVFPPGGLQAQTRLRLRAPSSKRIKSVTVNGERWKQFDAADEYIAIPARTIGVVNVTARY